MKRGGNHKYQYLFTSMNIFHFHEKTILKSKMIITPILVGLFKDMSNL